MDYPTPAEHTLTRKDAGRRLTVTVGENIRLSLPEAATGFRWVLAADATALRTVKDETVASALPRGGAGERVFTLEALRPTSTVLRLEKRRAWDGKVADEFA